MAKNKFFARMNAWLDDETGGLERVMEAAQEQAAAPDIEELSPAEKRWAQEEIEEERRIEAAMNDWTEKKGKPFVKALYNVLTYLGVSTISYNQPKGMLYKNENPFA